MANNNHFELNLDTQAPSGSITKPAAIINANSNLTIVKGDATFMKLWFNTTAAGTTSDPEYPSNPVAAATSALTAFSADGTYYYHMTLIDDVGNESVVYDTTDILFDSTAPTIDTTTGHAPYMADPTTGSHLVTNSLTGIVYRFEFSDGTGSGVSGVVSASITGADIDPIPLTLSASDTYYQGTLDFKSGTQDGTKTIYITVTDAAGNTSTAASASIVLDATLSKPVLTLQNATAETLPAYINFTGIKVSLTSSDTDIVGYKIWEGNNEPAQYTTQTAGTLNILQDVTLSGEGAHVFHAKVKDSGGNEMSADDRTVTLDTSNPTVSVSSNPGIISNNSGFTTAVLTLSGTDLVSGVASYTLQVGNVTVDSGATVPASYSLTSADSMVEGSNTITLTVTDNAGNEASDTCTVILDTTIPTASINTLNTWYNAQFDIDVVLADNNTVSTVYAWTSMTAVDTTKPVTADPISAVAGNKNISASLIDWTLNEDAANYMHVMVVDSVGNAGFAHAQFGYDSVAPTDPTANFGAGYYTSTSASVSINYYDATSGVAYMRITGDITNSTASDSWEPIVLNRSVTLTSGDGTKNVYVVVKDNAGNVSAQSQAASTILDETTPTPTLALFTADGSAAKPAISPVETLSVHIGITNTEPNGCEYLLYGDFTYGSQQAQGITEQAAVWTAFVPDSGETYMSVGNMYCTSGDGTKAINVKIKDTAGNISSQVSQSFEYDTSEPEVDIIDVDYNRISKVHELRRNAEGTIAGKYADQCTFSFESDETIQAYKVVAYVDATAAAAGSAADTPIKQTGDTGAHGSINMHATGLNWAANTPITSIINGADYEEALGAIVDPGDNDGAHFVVVYIQDMGGTWSVAAEFNA